MNDSDASSRLASWMRRFTPHLMWLLLTANLAWYGWSNHKVLKDYHRVRDNFHMTDAEMADFGAHQQEYFNALKRQDEFAAAIALRVSRQLERGNLEGAKNTLANTMAIYYRGHRLDGDTNVLVHIERYASTNAAISNAIHGKLE